jgi:hypothetical protein
VESFGGSLELAPPIEGKGATFVLSLPGIAQDRNPDPDGSKS